MTQDTLVTTTALTTEISMRKTMDTRITSYTGQPSSLGEPTSVTPVYTNVTDITQGSTLLAAISSLAANKNSKVTIYSENGITSLGSNPTGFYLKIDPNSVTALSLVAGKLKLSLSNVSTKEFVTAVTPVYGAFGIIGASIVFVKSLEVSKEIVTIK